MRQFLRTSHILLARARAKHFDRPAVHRRMVNRDSALAHHLFQMPKAQRVRRVPAHASHHYFQWIVEPKNHLSQGSRDRTFTEIKHRLDGRPCLLRQNRQTRFTSAAEQVDALDIYSTTFNPLIPQRAFHRRSPIQALKNWQAEKPDLFVKQVYRQLGLDT
jgi:hypothetical protein